ncbi:TetR family transcriptional regulator [Prauserella marina]|uniref:Regulatory protein, tetR family n=1 Tax=Prauserella marina TaxID=530584 RepID=A0A222VNF6_9PSEU|nr:TetR/AcrR family transcriptional regulator C-terminal domain-containing protein [Prauserella marina]ASR35382.1 TetR family transcriptional regulator [Prauserella marina]PWV84818.1 TetR family transcriptional regulator [Prauserella marina]SDC12352.1 regulatory protein, tetR family [Prauserella marina]
MTGKGESRLSIRIRVWLPSAQRARGPAPAYTRDQIADAAIDLADEQGIEAVTMRKVAARLGTGAMSLYRYVEGKDALFELMGDRILGREGWAPLTGDWRTDLADVARGHRRMLLEHQWLAALWSGKPTLGPNMLRGFERSMSIVDGLGLGIGDMFDTIGLISTWVSGYVQDEEATRAYLKAEEDGKELHAYFQTLVDSGDYPYFTRVVTEALTPHISEEARFERALSRLLDLIETTLPVRDKDEPATGAP